MCIRDSLSHDLLDLAVEAGRFKLGVGLVEHVVVLLGEELPEPVGQATANPHVDGAPAQLPDRGQASCPAHEHAVDGDRERLQQAVAVDGCREGVDVAEVGAVPGADEDRLDGCLLYTSPDPPPRGIPRGTREGERGEHDRDQ